MSKDSKAKEAPKNGNNKDNGHHDDGPTQKKAKTSAVSFDDILDANVRTKEREQALLESYRTSTPYRHAQITNVFQPDFLATCKNQIKQHSTVNFKETDLFRVYQSIDLANLVPQSELALKMPAVMRLREVLYSEEWRSYIERLAQLEPGTLSSQVDCACNCHAPGCHLLCHDDVIGTRKVSYILYLTESDWEESEGGALELYDSSVAGEKENDKKKEDNEEDAIARREPFPCPSKTILPLFNSMAFFVVEPGVSFHAVQEVLGERPRLSVQGWYHAAKTPDHMEHATLARLKEPTKTATSDNQQPQTNDQNCQDGYTPFKEQDPRKETTVAFSDSDREYLAQFMNETYLSQKSMDEIKQRFEEDSSVQLRNFFEKSWVQSVKKVTAKLDDDDHTDTTNNNRPKVGEDGYYEWGVSDEWKLVGPPHKQRYLQYQETQQPQTQQEDSSASASASAGELLKKLKQKVMQSPAFARYLDYVTSLGVPLGYKGQIRRFRPGLDYTVAHYGILTQTAVLDATVCFAAGTGVMSNVATATTTATGPDQKQDDSEKQGGKVSTLKDLEDGKQDEKQREMDNDDDNDDIDEADMLWQSDDVGGFECYIEADDYEKEQDEDGNDLAEMKMAAEAADEYNEDDDTNLLSVSASNNTLSLVYRDPGTMRFIKYVGSRAPSSRWDISMVYQVPEEEEGEDEDEAIEGTD